MPNYHQIILSLEKLIAGEVICDPQTLKKYSRDASLFTVRPQIVIYPKDKFDIQAIVKYINEVKVSPPGGDLEGALSLTVRAAGTDMSGGPLGSSIVLDITRYMHKIGEVNDFEIECEPGVYFRDLEKVLDKKDLMYPSYPASKDLCCVGGIVANNSAGEKTLEYGSTKDWVSEVEVVLADGSIFNFHEISFQELEKFLDEEIKPHLASPLKRGGISEIPIFIREIYSEIFRLINENKDLINEEKPIVSKNSSGYYLWDCVNWENKTISLHKLIIGSQGTLGIITKAKLKLCKRKKYSQMLTVLMPNLNQLVPLVKEISEFNPEAIETFDDHTFKIAMKFLPSIIWKLRGSIFQLAFSFIPEAWLALTGGIPKLILMAEFTGNSQEEANVKANLALKHVQQFPYKSRVTKSEVELQKYWLFRRESFNLLRSKLKGYRTAPFVEDVIVPIENMEVFMQEMQNILDKNKFIYTIAGHAGNGNFHIIPLMKLNSLEEVELIKKTSQEIFSLVQKYHGSIAAEHNDGLVRTPFLHFMFSDEMLELFKSVKEIFDPKNIFNPGKKVGGSVNDNFAKIELNR